MSHLYPTRYHNVGCHPSDQDEGYNDWHEEDSRLNQPGPDHRREPYYTYPENGHDGQQPTIPGSAGTPGALQQYARQTGHRVDCQQVVMSEERLVRYRTSYNEPVHPSNPHIPPPLLAFADHSYEGPLYDMHHVAPPTVSPPFHNHGFVNHTQALPYSLEARSEQHQPRDLQYQPSVARSLIESQYSARESRHSWEGHSNRNGAIRRPRSHGGLQSHSAGKPAGQNHSQAAKNSRKHRASYPTGGKKITDSSPSNPTVKKPENLSSSSSSPVATTKGKEEKKDGQVMMYKHEKESRKAERRSPPSSAGNSGEPMEVDDEVAYVQTFREMADVQVKAEVVSTSAVDIDMELTDLEAVKCIIVFDTNVLLSDEGEVFFEEMNKLGDANYLHHVHFLMPCTVVQELDNLKGGKDKNGTMHQYARRSRTASKFWCDRLRKDSRFGTQNAVDDRRPARQFYLAKADDRIVNCFFQLFDKFSPDKKIFLVTNDHNMQLKAMSNVKPEMRQQIIFSKDFMLKLRETLEAERNMKNGKISAPGRMASNTEAEDSLMENAKQQSPAAAADSLKTLRQLHECLDRALLSLMTVFLETRLTSVYNGEDWKLMYNQQHWRTVEAMLALLLKHWHAFTAGSTKLQQHKAQWQAVLGTVKSITGQTMERRIVARALVLNNLVGLIEKCEEEALRKQYGDKLDLTEAKLTLWSDLYGYLNAGTGGAKDNLEREMSAYLSTGR